MRRTVSYAAISLPLQKQGKDEAQRSIRTFYEAVKHNLDAARQGRVSDRFAPFIIRIDIFVKCKFLQAPFQAGCEPCRKEPSGVVKTGRSLRNLEIGSRKRALEIFRGTLPPQRSEEAQGRKMSGARRDHDFQRSRWVMPIGCLTFLGASVICPSTGYSKSRLF